MLATVKPQNSDAMTVLLVYSVVAMRGPGVAVPSLTANCAPPFWFTGAQYTSIVFGTSRNDKTTDNNLIMEKGIIMFKHNLFFSFLGSL